MEITTDEIIVNDDLKISKGTIVRLILSIFSIVNVVLAKFDINIIPISEVTVSQIVNYALMIFSFVWSFWKNNSFTKAALAGDYVMHTIKDGEIIEEEEKQE